MVIKFWVHSEKKGFTLPLAIPSPPTAVASCTTSLSALHIRARASTSTHVKQLWPGQNMENFYKQECVEVRPHERARERKQRRAQIFCQVLKRASLSLALKSKSPRWPTYKFLVSRPLFLNGVQGHQHYALFMPRRGNSTPDQRGCKRAG